MKDFMESSNISDLIKDKQEDLTKLTDSVRFSPLFRILFVSNILHAAYGNMQVRVCFYCTFTIGMQIH